jgi:DNA-binding SARP family transcriptional activator
LNTLQIFLFGSTRIKHADLISDVKVTRAVKALLAYLLLYRHRTHQREVLANLFWGDYNEERARSCFSTTLWRLRRILEPKQKNKGTYLLTTTSGEIGFNNESDYWLDVAVFEGLISKIVKKPIDEMESNEITELEKALRLYTGDLLEGFYDDWALRERERLNIQYLRGLEHLMDYYGYHKDYEQALAYGRQILAQNPLREEIHRKEMRLYAQNGQRALAIKHYENCNRILQAELGINPMEETQELHKRILELTDDKDVSLALRLDHGTRKAKEPTNSDLIFQKVQSAINDCDKLRRKLLQIMRHLQ